VDSDLAYLFGEAIGTRLAAGRLVIGGDGQPGSAAVREALRSGAVRTGCTVYDIGTVPTPALYFAKDRLWADGAAMITGTERASGGHLALSLGKLPATDLDLAEIEQAVEQRGPFAVGRGQLIRSDIAEPYRSFLVAHFVPAQPLPVVIASEEGNALRIAEETLRLVGYPVIRCPLPSSAGSAAVPTPLSPVDALCGAVVEHDGHLGAFYTGNGSRVVLVDETGTVLAPPQVLALLARALLRFEPGSQVVYDARLGTGVSREIRRIGGEPTSVGPGPSGVKRLVLERGAVLGADAEGGYCFRTMGTEDALYTTLVMLRIASHVGGALRPTLDRLDL
jgi:phosphomannomutase/phosphoglucomutase